MNKRLLLLIISLVSLTNYFIAQQIQQVFLNFFPSLSPLIAITIPWLIIGMIPVLLTWEYSGLTIDFNKITEHKSLLFIEFAIITIILFLFVLSGFSQAFHAVKYPILFFLITPIVEELLFRGWIYGQLEKIHLSPILLSSLLFSIHHLQYFSYRPTPFAVFQIGYTFLLGLLFGKMRKQSGSIYVPLLAHIFINWAVVSF